MQQLDTALDDLFEDFDKESELLTGVQDVKEVEQEEDLQVKTFTNSLNMNSQNLNVQRFFQLPFLQSVLY